jgi:hypothetical protein
MPYYHFSACLLLRSQIMLQERSDGGKQFISRQNEGSRDPGGGPATSSTYRHPTYLRIHSTPLSNTLHREDGCNTSSFEEPTTSIFSFKYYFCLVDSILMAFNNIKRRTISSSIRATSYLRSEGRTQVSAQC